MFISGSHDPWLVCLSIVIAIVSSYTALDLAGRVRSSIGRQRRVWLASASITMGGGIWAMHFVAMLAYRMPGMDFGYDVRLTALSLIVAIGATSAGFAAMSRDRVHLHVLLGAGVFMGVGVVAMHYIGMAAMKMPAMLVYDARWVAASVIVALVAATAALWLAFRRNGGIERLGAAVLMGAAVSGMHYTAMQGVHFADFGGQAVFFHGMDQTVLALGVTIAAFVILFIALSASVFDRRLAESADREAAALRFVGDRFRALYRGTPLPLHSLDHDGHLEQVSDTWLDLTGYTRDEVIGRLLTDFMTPDSADRVMTVDMPLILHAGFARDMEHGFVTKSGAVRNVLLSARVDRDAYGAFLGILGGLTDITERRLTEEALRQTQKLEAIGQLTGGVAHDFNNLLAVVVGNLDLVRRKVAHDPKVLRLVENALEGANRGASLTQRLLSFARRQDLRPAAVDVAALVNGMSDLLQRSLGPMVRIETRFTMGLPAAQVDSHQLEMAILNLAVNARDAMSNGGVLVIGASVSRHDGGEGLAAGTYLRIDVTDEGCGMDAATIARASEPFFTTKDVGKGTGLGLSMAQGLAGQSGGRLAIRSEVGLGTTVELWLPLAASSASSQIPGVSPQVAGPMRPMSILVVDDDRLVLENTTAMLEDLGHRVVQASSAREALDILPTMRDLGLIVSDHLMPGMTGMELAQAVTADLPYLPVLLVSGYCELAGGNGLPFPLLAKPFNQSALERAVRSAVTGANVVDFDSRRSQMRHTA